jgi:hypothetical protein
MDRDEAYAIPYSWMSINKRNLSMTENGEKSFWQVPLTTLGDGSLAINVSKIGEKFSLLPYRFRFSEA